MDRSAPLFARSVPRPKGRAGAGRSRCAPIRAGLGRYATGTASLSLFLPPSAGHLPARAPLPRPPPRFCLFPSGLGVPVPRHHPAHALAHPAVDQQDVQPLAYRAGRPGQPAAVRIDGRLRGAWPSGRRGGAANVRAHPEATVGVAPCSRGAAAALLGGDSGGGRVYEPTELGARACRCRRPCCGPRVPSGR